MSADSTNSTLRPILLIIAILLGIFLFFPILMMVFGVSMGGMMGGFGPGGMAGPGGMSPLWGFGMLFVLLIILSGLGYLLYQSLS